MNSELEEQLDTLIQKTNKDFLARISRIVTRHLNKALKEQARELKSNNGPTTTRRGKKHVEKASSNRQSRSKYSDSDSDGYYSD